MLPKPHLQRALKRCLATVLQGERQPPQRLVQMAVDGLAAASVLRGELCSCLFSCAIGCPKLVVLQALATIELLAAVMAFVALLTVAPPVLFDPF